MRLMVKSRSISVWRKVGNRKRFSTYLRKKYILIAKKMMADPASFNKMILLILLIKGKEKLRSYILANISYRKKNLSNSKQSRRKVWKSGWAISNTKSNWPYFWLSKSIHDHVVLMKFEFCAHLARLLRKLDHVLLWILSTKTGLWQCSIFAE